MSILIIAEKPSVAQTIAAALDVTTKKDGYMENNGLLVSWCVGHLISMADAGSYDERYKKWRYEDLPIQPKEWHYVLTPGKEKQFAVLKELMHRADVSEVVNACDGLSRRADGFQHEVYDLLQTVFIHLRVLAQNIVFDIVHDDFTVNIYCALRCRFLSIPFRHVPVR